jgi:CRP-like cAMP-binding protein
LPEITRIQMVVGLQSSDLFSFCKAEEVLRIAEIAQEQKFEPGDKIYERNTTAQHLYSIVHGEVELARGDGSSRAIGPLATFGLREILCGRLRTEEAIAKKSTLLIAIESEDFFDLLANNIDIVKALFRHLLEDPHSPEEESRL